MPDISLKMHPGLIAVLNDFVSSCANSLIEKGLAQSVQTPEDDDDLAETWYEHLREAMRRDCQQILKLIRAPEFGRGPVSVSEEEMYGILRACSAVRLRLRETSLSKIPDEALENGDLSMDIVDMDLRRALSAYVFLAYLQESIVEALDGRGGYA